MTAVEAPPGRQRASLEWAVRAAWLLAFLATALQLLGALVAAGDAVETLTSNPLRVSIQTDEPLHSVGRNSYSGPFVADDSTITATRVTAEATDVATSTRMGLAFGPLTWALTGAGVAWCITLAFGRSLKARANPRKAARAIVVAATVTAIGTSGAQILDEIGRTGLQGVMWHGATGMGRLGAGGAFTFQFGWLAVAVGAVALAAVIARQDATVRPASQ